MLQHKYYTKLMCDNTIVFNLFQVFEIKVYTTASDIWSYGVLLYEIYSCGKVPYFDISNTVSIHCTVYL